MKPDTYREHLNDLQLEIEELMAKLAAYQSTMGQLSDTAQSTKEGDTISRQAAIDDMKNMYQAAEKWGREATDDVIKARAESCMATLFEMKLRIEKLPSAQPEIVRCKDCAHRNGDYCHRFHDGYSAFIHQDDFCSYAERRTDE